MNNLLTIGEVAKLRGISVKALRYYDQLQILIPTYINPNTGYRYYALEQLVILDLILICVESDIPLKNFKKYIDEDENINVALLLKDGEEIANKKMHKLKDDMEFLKKISVHIETSKTKLKTKQLTKRNYKKRCFLVKPLVDNKIDLVTYRKNLQQIYKECEHYKIKDEFNQGLLFKCENNVVKTYFFLQIMFKDAKYFKGETIIINENDFDCEVKNMSDFYDNVSQYISHYKIKNNDILIASELTDVKINQLKIFFEIQCSYD